MEIPANTQSNPRLARDELISALNRTATAECIGRGRGGSCLAEPYQHGEVHAETKP